MTTSEPLASGACVVMSITSLVVRNTMMSEFLGAYKRHLEVRARPSRCRAGHCRTARTCEAGRMTAPIDVAPGVLVLTSRTMCTTSTVVHDGKRALLVDPAWHADELGGIADLLTARDLRVELGWATHAHHDHLLWHPRFGPAPRLATPSAAATARAQLTQIRTALAPTLPAELRTLAGQVQELDGAQLPWSGPVAEVVVHHGHSPGHGALWLPEVRVLLAGDMLSETEIP